MILSNYKKKNFPNKFTSKNSLDFYNNFRVNNLFAIIIVTTSENFKMLQIKFCSYLNNPNF